MGQGDFASVLRQFALDARVQTGSAIHPELLVSA